MEFRERILRVPGCDENWRREKTLASPSSGHRSALFSSSGLCLLHFERPSFNIKKKTTQQQHLLCKWMYVMCVSGRVRSARTRMSRPGW